MPSRVNSRSVPLSRHLVRPIRVENSAVGGNSRIESPRRLHSAGIFSYPSVVVACYRLYPQHRGSIVVSHTVFGVLLLSVFLKWDSVPRAFFGVLRVVHFLILALSHWKVVASRTANERC